MPPKKVAPARGKSSSPTRKPASKKDDASSSSSKAGPSKGRAAASKSPEPRAKGGAAKGGAAKGGTSKNSNAPGNKNVTKGKSSGKTSTKSAENKTDNASDADSKAQSKEEGEEAEKKEGEKKDSKDEKKEGSKEEAKKDNSKSATDSEKPLDPNEGPKVITGKIFMQAVTDSDARALKTYLFARGPLPDDVLNYQNNSKMTPLMMATQKKTDFESCSLVKILLSSIDAPKKKSVKVTPAKKGDPTEVEIPEGMVSPLSGCTGQAGQLDLNLQNRDGYTAMHFAARKGFAETLLQLIDAGADYEIVSTGAEKVTAEELTNDKKCKEYLERAVVLKAERERLKAVAVQGLACYTSVLKGDVRGVVRVGEKQAPPETYSFRPSPKDHYMIRHAIDLGHLEILKIMLTADAEKDVYDSRGRTPLMHLVSLPRAGSYPTTKFSRDKEALRQEMLDQILNNGTTTNAFLERRDKDGNTALHIAAENGYIEDLTQLIDKGCDVNARQISNYPYRGLPSQREKSGDTALIIACRKRQGFFECTPIGTALQGNFMEVLSCLRYEGKCDVNMRGSNGMTALMWAVHHQDLEMIEWLIDEGANINEQENFGQTALMLACESLKFDSAKFLLQWDLEEHIARKEQEAVEMAETIAREEAEREKRRKEKRKLLKLGASADPAALAALEAKERKATKTKVKPPSKDSLLSKRKERSKQKAKKLEGGKVITRWPRMLGYYKEQNPDEWKDIFLPLEEGAIDYGEDRPPKPYEECNPNIPALNDATPLIVLARKCLAANRVQMEPLVDLMIKKGAKINQKSSDGMSAMMWAVLNNDLGLAKQLLGAGADPTITDQLGISLLDNCKSGSMRMTIKSAVDAWTTKKLEEDADANM